MARGGARKALIGGTVVTLIVIGVVIFLAVWFTRKSSGGGGISACPLTIENITYNYDRPDNVILGSIYIAVPRGCSSLDSASLSGGGFTGTGTDGTGTGTTVNFSGLTTITGVSMVDNTSANVAFSMAVPPHSTFIEGQLGFRMGGRQSNTVSIVTAVN